MPTSSVQERSRIVRNDDLVESSGSTNCKLALWSEKSEEQGRPRVEVADFAEFLSRMSLGSIDLILTDPPYTISRKTGFKNLGPNSVARFAVEMDFGEWDQSLINLTDLCRLSWRGLRFGGTAIIFYDLWKLSYLSDAMISAGFKQIRLIEWVKTNPVPLNSKRNYLTNSREIAVLGVKGGKPTFNSEYDTGVYKYPIPHNGQRYHPTQKPLEMFCELVKKHSNPGDLVVDPFLGSGTTALAAVELEREFAGCDLNEDYIQIASERLRNGK